MPTPGCVGMPLKTQSAPGSGGQEIEAAKRAIFSRLATGEDRRGATKRNTSDFMRDSSLPLSRGENSKRKNIKFSKRDREDDDQAKHGPPLKRPANSPKCCLSAFPRATAASSEKYTRGARLRKIPRTHPQRSASDRPSATGCVCVCACFRRHIPPSAKSIASLAKPEALVQAKEKGSCPSTFCKGRNVAGPRGRGTERQAHVLLYYLEKGRNSPRVSSPSCLFGHRAAICVQSITNQDLALPPFKSPSPRAHALKACWAE